MPWATIGASVGSSLLGSIGSSKAARRQQEAAAAAAALKEKRFEEGKQLQTPFYAGGLEGLAQLTQRMPELTAGYDPAKLLDEPGYRFGMDQGQKALERSLAAKGSSVSGEALMRAARYGTDYSTTKLGDAFNRDRASKRDAYDMLSGLSGIGQRAGENISREGNAVAGSIGNDMIGGANAGAANDIAQGNIWGNLLNQGASAFKTGFAPDMGIDTGSLTGEQRRARYFAEGGAVRREPVVGTREPLPGAGRGGGGLSRDAILAALDAARQPAAPLAPAMRPGTIPRVELAVDRATRFADGGAVRGKTRGKADKVDAKLSGGEHVFDAEIVAMLGDGNTEAGHKLLEELKARVRAYKRNAPAGRSAPALELEAGAPMPIDTSIYSQFLKAPRSVADYDRDARAAELDQLALGEARDVAVGKQRARARQDQLQQLMRGLPATATDDDRLAALRGGAFFGEADTLEKGIGERAKSAAAAAKDVQETKGKEYDLRRKKYEHRIEGLRQFAQPEDARQWLADSVAGDAMSMKEATGMMARVPADPAQFTKWRDETLMSVLDAAKQAGFVMPDANAQLQAKTSLATNAATNARSAAEGAANRGVTLKVAGMVNDRARDLATTAKADKATAHRTEVVEKGVTKFSDTLQKEGIPELDTAVETAEKVLDAYRAPDGKMGNVPGIGRVVNALPAGVLSEDGKAVRRAIAQVRNIVLSARSGAAVTDQELRRLIEEIGSGVGMNADDLRAGLKAVRDRVEVLKQNAAAGVSDDVLNTYTGRGGVKIGRAKPGAPGAKPRSAFEYLGVQEGGE